MGLMKSRNIIDSFNYAIKGIIHAVKSERNMKIHIAFGIAVFLLSLFFDLTKTEFMIICLPVSMVFICEMFNTASEVVVDLLEEKYNLKAKIIKDVSAGAVLISAFLLLL